MSDNDKDKAKEIFCLPNAIDFMSSEESDNDDPAPSSGSKPRKVCKLVWEKSKLKNLKAKLDKAYLEGLRERQRLTTAHLSRTEEPSVPMALVGLFVENNWLQQTASGLRGFREESLFWKMLYRRLLFLANTMAVFISSSHNCQLFKSNLECDFF